MQECFWVREAKRAGASKAEAQKHVCKVGDRTPCTYCVSVYRGEVKAKKRFTRGEKKVLIFWCLFCPAVAPFYYFFKKFPVRINRRRKY